MHKITKGLKKKKKNKKSKHHKEEEFKPEELEAYRKEHQGTSEEPTKNEEWKKFIALTSGVDDILKKTQGDLDRIKSTSFFQRIPPASEQLQKQQQAEQIVQQIAAEAEETKKTANFGIVEVSESESDEEDEDDIFDTAYIDAIATGEVKLAYIPESPTLVDGDDPFDTSIAERAILGPVSERKGKKLVPIGAAVEVLTGRVQLPTCATQRPTVNRRQVLKERDLLLGSFDDNANSVPQPQTNGEQVVQRTLLDDDDSIPISNEPLDFSRNLQIELEQSAKDRNKEILEEFDNIGKELDDDDFEFEALAAESLTKPTQVVAKPLLLVQPVQKATVAWNAFGENKVEEEEDVVEVDPFDTTFAENILPGKAELKQIENEILNDFDFDPRSTEDIKPEAPVTKVSKRKDSCEEGWSIADKLSEAALKVTPIRRDLLGGSNTDLSTLDQPLQPLEKPDDNYIEYSDPFDTSIVEVAKQPGQTELKFLEKELLGDLKKQSSASDDDEFNPRACESFRERGLSRPDVLNINNTSKSVSFDLPSSPTNALGVNTILKPLTPFYVRKSSIPTESEPVDPFDTSYISDLAPGQAELKLLESELLDSQQEEQIHTATKALQNLVKPKKVVQIDLLGGDNNSSVIKALTPAQAQVASVDELSYRDPFDTSIACNILPGKTELKLLESELIHSSGEPANLLTDLTDFVFDKALTPQSGDSIGKLVEDIDPFDTSFASNIQPGQAELKQLESELF